MGYCTLRRAIVLLGCFTLMVVILLVPVRDVVPRIHEYLRLYNEPFVMPTGITDYWIPLDDQKISLVRRVAFFDERKDFGPQIIVLLFHKEATAGDYKKKLYAYIPSGTSPTSRRTCLKASIWRKIGKLDNQAIPPELYVTYILSIKGPSLTSVPSENISLSHHSDCRIGTLYPEIPVFYDKRPQRDSTFATCIQKGLFGKIDIQFIVDWVELNRAIGASIVTILVQVHETGDKLKKALATQIEEGLVELVEWGIIMNVRDYGMSASANECVYRNVNRAKYVAVHDADEVLVPQKHNTWHELINNISNVDKYASYSFTNTLFFPDEPLLEEPPCTDTHVPRYFEWTKMNISYRPKVMVNLDNTIATYCHDIWHWKDSVRKEYKVPRTLGLSHHYRGPNKDQNGAIKNDVLKRYITTIIPRLKSIYCNNKIFV